MTQQNKDWETMLNLLLKHGVIDNKADWESRLNDTITVGEVVEMLSRMLKA